MQMGPRVQDMVGMEDAEGIKNVLESHTVTCTNLNTLGVEVVAQVDWAEVSFACLSRGTCKLTERSAATVLLVSSLALVEEAAEVYGLTPI